MFMTYPEISFPASARFHVGRVFVRCRRRAEPPCAAPERSPVRSPERTSHLLKGQTHLHAGCSQSQSTVNVVCLFYFTCVSILPESVHTCVPGASRVQREESDPWNWSYGWL